MKAALVFGLLVALAFASSSSSSSWSSSSSSSSSSSEDCMVAPRAGDTWITTDGKLTWIDSETFVFEWADGSDGILIASFVATATAGQYQLQELADGPSAADPCTTTDVGIYRVVFPLAVSGDCNTFSLDTVSDDCTARGTGFDGVTFVKQGTMDDEEMCMIPESGVATARVGANTYEFVFLGNGLFAYDAFGATYVSQFTQNNGGSVSLVDITTSDPAPCSDAATYDIDFNRDCSRFELTLVSDTCAGRDALFAGTVFQVESEDSSSSDDSDSMTSSDDSDSWTTSSSSWGKAGKKGKKDGKSSKSSKTSKSAKKAGKKGKWAESMMSSDDTDSTSDDWSWTSSDDSETEWVTSSSLSSSDNKINKVNVAANKVAGSVAPSTNAKWIAIPVSLVGLFVGLAVAAVVLRRRNNQYVAI